MTETPSSPDEIADLVERARCGDVDAKEDLFERYRPYLNYVAQRAIGPGLGRRCDPSDIVQEAYVAATRGFESFQGSTEPEFTDWIVKILHSKAIDALRYHKAQIRDAGRECEMRQVEGSAVVSWCEPVSRDASPSQFVIRGEHALRLLNALAQLPVEQQSAVKLRYLEGEKLTAVAARLQRSPDAVVGLIRRGLTALRQSLGQELLS